MPGMFGFDNLFAMPGGGFAPSAALQPHIASLPLAAPVAQNLGAPFSSAFAGPFSSLATVLQAFGGHPLGAQFLAQMLGGGGG